MASVPPASQTAPAQHREPAAPPGQTAPAQQSLPATPSSPSQQPATTPTTQAPPAALKSQAEAAPSQAPAPQASAANAPSQQKSPAETTGVAAREENTRQADADPTRSTNRVDDVQRTAQGSSSNRCDVQACASAYRSFRESDCTYRRSTARGGSAERLRASRWRASRGSSRSAAGGAGIRTCVTTTVRR